MDWTPLAEADLTTMIADAVAAMNPPARSLWNLIRIKPVKWQLHPWGDDGGGFWVVAIIGRQIIWFNDIEQGFNISQYDALEEIAEYFCNQDELNHTIQSLLQQIETGQTPAKLGPPEPLN